MTEYDEPNWQQVPSRTISGDITAYMPFSPTSSRREAIIMRTLSSVLEADPQFDIVNDLKSALLGLDQFENDEALADEAWGAFTSAYLTSGEGGIRGSQAEAGSYIIPFHSHIPQHFETGEPRDWGLFYQMLMTDGKVPGFNEELHEDLKLRYTDLEPSNTVEELVISSLKVLLESRDSDADQVSGDGGFSRGIPPYVPDLAEVFQKDLKSWLAILPDQPSALWLEALKDLVCFHYMMYMMQLGRNLGLEYEHAKTRTLAEFTPRCRPIYFGLWDETASNTRDFANEWNDENLAGEVYDSWGRLVVMRILTETTMAEESEIEPQPLTLAEAITNTPPDFQERCREAVLAEFPDEDRPDESDVPTLVDAARSLDRAVRRFNSRKPSLESQAAYTLGFKVIRQLGEGKERKYIRVQRGRAGTNSRLNQGSLRLFARLFEEQSVDGHLRKFIRYLENRGIRLDDESRERMIEQLDQMSLLNKMSDSKEAIYVESI